jgi:hypothetical protein
MVNQLLTISIKVNIAPSAESNLRPKGREKMKKSKVSRGWMSWLLGHGWDTAGGNG